MKRIQGILGLLVCICAVTAFFNGSFLIENNLANNIRWTGLFGVLGIGVAVVIITGGIDLSIGSVVGLTGCLLAILLQVDYVDSGQDFTIKEVDAAQRIVVLDPSPAAIGHQDHLQIPDPRTGNPVGFSVNRHKPAVQPNAVALHQPVTTLKVGDTCHWVRVRHMNTALAVGLVLLASLAIGLTHGLLVAKMRLQPFVVTLCGLLFYRGLTRVMAGDTNVGLGPHHESLKYLASGQPFQVPVPFIKYVAEGRWSRVQHQMGGDGVWTPVIHKAGAPMLDALGQPLLDAAGKPLSYAADTPQMLDAIAWVGMPMPFLIMLALAAVAAVFLHKTVWGRYLLALGRNEQAAVYSGINTDRMVILAYVICSLMAGLGGILFVLDLNSVQPSSHGNFYELYAIAAAVLGGCSLRGGEGSIAGVVIGAAVMRVLPNAINLMGIASQMEFAVIGLVILAGVIGDELVKRMSARRRAKEVEAKAPG